MADKTAIEWTDATWNPITGCSVKSPGCKICYAMKLAGTRLKNHPSRAGLTVDTQNGPVWTGEVRLNESWLDQPLRWTRPRMIFVVAHGDLFYEEVPDEWIDRVFAVMARAPHHKFQVLTKRPDRMLKYFSGIQNGDEWLDGDGWRDALIEGAAQAAYAANHPGEDPCLWLDVHTPLPNVWIGASVEDQRRADERRAPMEELAARGWVTWVSYEPALEAVDWQGWDFIRWMVSGGESDLDNQSARPSLPEMHRAARDYCAPRGIAYNFKQWGAWIDADQIAARFSDDAYIVRDGVRWRPSLPLNFRDAAWLAQFLGYHHEHHIDGRTLLRAGKKNSGRLLDGRLHDDFPQVLA